MKHIITDGVFLSRAPEGPLAVHISTFATALRAQGYALASMHRQILLAACFSQWLHHEGVALRHITSEHPSQYLRDRVRRVQIRPGDAAALRHLLACLRGEGVIAPERSLDYSQH